MRKIHKESITDQVFEEIKRNIVESKWKEGDRIQSENDLAEQLGVSRVSVRAALQKLQALGYIETRSTNRSYVKKFSLGSLLNAVSPDIVMNETALSELREFRNNMELDCCRLAIERHTTDELNELKECLNQMISVTKEDDFESFIGSDQAFHNIIARMTHNSLYVITENATSPAISLYNRTLYLNRLKKFNNVSQLAWDEAINWHTNIFIAIRDRNFDLCKETYSEILSPL